MVKETVLLGGSSCNLLSPLHQSSSDSSETAQRPMDRAITDPSAEILASQTLHSSSRMVYSNEIRTKHEKRLRYSVRDTRLNERERERESQKNK